MNERGQSVLARAALAADEQSGGGGRYFFGLRPQRQ